MADTVGADTQIVLAGATGAGRTTLVRALALALGIADGAERTTGGGADAPALLAVRRGARTLHTRLPIGAARRIRAVVCQAL